MKNHKLDIANETPSQRTRRLGPSRAIVRFVNEHKGRDGNPTRTAVLECKHVRSTDMTPRTSVRCAKCRDRKPADVSSLKITRYVKPSKRAA